MHTCFLVGAAPTAAHITPQPGDFIIAADGGLHHLLAQGIAPDLVIGDMDSLQGELPAGIPCIKHPAEKDDTDLALAFWEGYHRGFRRFVLIGAGGGRFDHSVANLQLLVKAAKLGTQTVMHNEDGFVTALAGPGKIAFNGSGTVSVFAYGEQSTGVTIMGMKYNITNETLLGDTPRGVSNEAMGQGHIAVQQGTLLIFYEAGIELC